MSFWHLATLTGLTKDVGGEALLQPLCVHVPLAHDGAGVIDLHTMQHEPVIFQSKYIQ